MKRVVLNKPIVYAEGLTYDEANDMLDAAVKTPLINLVSFSMSCDANADTWKVVGYPNDISKAFLKDPESFVIDF